MANLTDFTFTLYGRPVELNPVRMDELKFVTVANEIRGIVPANDEPQPEQYEDTYALTGPDSHTIARNLRTYAFARQAALRWSAALAAPVDIVQQLDEDTFQGIDDTVDVSIMRDEDFADAWLDAARARIDNVVYALRVNLESVAKTLADAESACEAVRNLAAMDGVPTMRVADVAIAVAEAFEPLYWTTIIEPDDDDMLGELESAT